MLDDVIAHAKQASPDECCGLLVGSGLTIDQAVRMTNLERGPTRFRVDPGEHLVLVKQLRGSGREVVGAYHSHPKTPAVPSVSDRREAFYPDFVHVIVSLAGPEPDVRAWHIAGDAATETRIEIAGRGSP